MAALDASALDTDGDGTYSAEESAAHEAMVAATPLRRLGEPADVAAAVLYLLSPAASYVTGEVVAVSGGIQGSNLELGLPDL